MPDECNQECMHLNDTISIKRTINQFAGFSLADCHEARLETYVNRHPIQPLGPPEKVALYQTISTDGVCGGDEITPHTDCCKHREGIQAFRSFRAIVPVGIRKRPAPTHFCFCNQPQPHNSNGDVDRETNVRVVSDRRDCHRCS